MCHIILSLCREKVTDHENEAAVTSHGGVFESFLDRHVGVLAFALLYVLAHQCDAHLRQADVVATETDNSLVEDKGDQGTAASVSGT